MAEEKHIPLPLKYRPMTFDDVIGQDHVVQTLRHAIETKRVANAYLFIGPRGIGKTTLSRVFAKALNCTSPHGVEPCGECANCREIAQGSSMDVIELDAASHNSVEDVRKIIESAPFKPAISRYKIFIIDECHMLSTAAWNALLKTLEEPPPHVRFIFATTEGDKVLATIVSRCQRFDLRRIQTHDIVARLKAVCDAENLAVESDALLAIARGAEGGMRDALSSLDQLSAFAGEKITEKDALGIFGLVSRRELEALVKSVLTGDTAGILASVEAFDSAGKNMRRLAAEILSHFRNLVVLQALGPKTAALEATPEQIAVLEEQARLASPERVFRICDQIAELDEKLRNTLSVRTLLEMTLIRCGHQAVTATINELMQAVKRLQANAGMSAAPMKESAPQSPVAPTPRAAVQPPPPPAQPAVAPPAPSPARASHYAEHHLPDASEMMKRMSGKSAAPVPPQASKTLQPLKAVAPAQPQAPSVNEAEKVAEAMADPILNKIIAENKGLAVKDCRVKQKGEVS